jgi:23S rRNA (uracil1939-C5)-methyltransferase
MRRLKQLDRFLTSPATTAKPFTAPPARAKQVGQPKITYVVNNLRRRGQNSYLELTMRKKRKNQEHKPKPPRILDGTQFRIDHIGRHGDGVAVSDAGPIYIPFALPGETITIQRSGNIVSNPSSDRIEAFCPHFARCGGCMTQHINLERYIAWKRGTVETALSNRGLNVPIADLIDAHGLGRRRTTLHIKKSKDTTTVGFMRASSNELIEIYSCPILTPALKGAPELARALGDAFPASSSPLDMQITATDSGLDCDVRGVKEISLDSRINLSEVAAEYDLARISVDRETVAERRPPILKFGIANMVLPAGGFLQATATGEDVLSKLIMDRVGSAKHAADLFSGTGTFALRLAEKMSITAVDGWRPAVEALTRAVHHTPGLKPVVVEQRDLSGHPLLTNELNRFEAVVFDPPRAGAKEQANELSTSNVQTIVAVSCNPTTFSRDAEILIKGGYELIDVTPVDQFKWTAHIELVGHFKRN